MNNYMPPLLVTISSGFVSLASGGACVAPPLHEPQYNCGNSFARTLAFTEAAIRRTARKSNQRELAASAHTEAALNRLAQRLVAIQSRKTAIAGITHIAK